MAKTKKKQPRKGGGGKKGTRHQLLEATTKSLSMLGFKIFKTYGEFRQQSAEPGRYIICNYPHGTLYSTPGKKEALIVGDPNDPGSHSPFLTDEGRTHILIEDKFQDNSGSVDEKFPYVWESFLVSDIKNWVMVYDGMYWRTGRGEKAIEWLNNRALSTEFSVERRLYVVNLEGFHELMRKAFAP